MVKKRTVRDKLKSIGLLRTRKYLVIDDWITFSDGLLHGVRRVISVLFEVLESVVSIKFHHLPLCKILSQGYNFFYRLMCWRSLLGSLLVQILTGFNKVYYIYYNRN